MVDAAYYQDLLRPHFQGRRLIICGLPLAGTTAFIKGLRSLGAERCLVVANGVGTGPLPSEEDAQWVIAEVHAAEITDEIRQTEELLRQPPAEVVEAIEAFDPERRALVLASPVTLSVLPPRLAGRPVWARRTAASIALEDKLTVEQFWDSVGVARVPSGIVPVELDALRRACTQLDRGSGTAWAGDAKEGPHGGAERFRWVRDDRALPEAIAFFSRHCDRVRVMPFLEGIPFSIHGIVIGESVIAIRPVEMVTLRQVDTDRLRYCGVADFWDPPSSDREYMRETARRVGHALRERIAFRGPFTIDGVMTEDGFRPTELNPRFGVGLGVIGQAVPGFPLTLLMLALLAGEPLDYRPTELQELLIDSADRTRTGGAATVIHTPRTETLELSLADQDGDYRIATAGDVKAAALLVGPGAMGGFVRFTPEPKFLPAGLSTRATSRRGPRPRRPRTGDRNRPPCLGDRCPALDAVHEVGVTTAPCFRCVLDFCVGLTVQPPFSCACSAGHTGD